MPIFYIKEMVFAGLHMLRTVQITSGGLRSMSPLTPVKNTLVGLTLTNNNISGVPPDYFLGFKKLKRLTMTGNSLSLIPNISPLCNTIINLQLGSNKIYSISGGLIRTVYPLLQVLNLKRNTIKKFDSDILNFWPSLRVLSLSYNLIARLPTSYPEGRMKLCSEENASVCTFYLAVTLYTVIKQLKK